MTPRGAQTLPALHKGGDHVEPVYLERPLCPLSPRGEPQPQVALSAAVRQLVDALTEVWPGPGPLGGPSDETGLPTPPTHYPRPKKGTVSFVRPRILEILERHPQGLSPEEIRRQLGLQSAPYT